ncbi:MAG: transglutaminase domain-containing protein, partial [Planctomycetes bacterium]|nr:transglutaminase domain-containing protein [Planctomycetota bacterium]
MEYRTGFIFVGVMILLCFIISDPVGAGEDVVSGDRRTPGMRVIELGANSSLYLTDPVAGDVRLISSVENLGPDPMTYLKFYTLYPLDRDRQDVIDLEFYPTGGTFLTDDRGQPVVYYYYSNVPAGVKHETWWRGRVRIWEMHYEIDPADVETLGEIPAEIAVQYLADDPLFQITHPVITTARDQALQGETHPLLMAQKIFAWVQNHLVYDAAGGWDDAVTVIERGNGSCSEYSFAFMALCRAAGIPSRWIGALVRRGDAEGPGPFQDDPHHRWAQVYLPGIGWVHCNVQGGSWGYLPNRYLVISESSGPSNYLKTRYDSYRYWSWGGGAGSASTERYGLWYSDLDSFYNPVAAGGSQVWADEGVIRISWDILGEFETAGTELTMELNRLGQTVWQTKALAPDQGSVDIPLASILDSGPHFDLKLYRSDKPELAGFLGPIEIKNDTDDDRLDDNWEIRYWGNLNQDQLSDPDQDGANNLGEYYGMTDPNKPNLFAGDVQETAGQVGQGHIGYNEYGCDLSGKIEVNEILWDKSLGVHADSWIEY